MKFTIVIEPGTPTTAYGVVVPDLPGCFSAGDSIEDASQKVKEAITAFCEILAETGQGLPNVKALTDWQTDPEYAGWTWEIVDVPVEKLFGTI